MEAQNCSCRVVGADEITVEHLVRTANGWMAYVKRRSLGVMRCSHTYIVTFTPDVGGVVAPEWLAYMLPVDLVATTRVASCHEILRTGPKSVGVHSLVDGSSAIAFAVGTHYDDATAPQ